MEGSPILSKMLID
jgi:N-alpha-acetyltransferase 15/16, NatA auxiliary subunit